MPDSEIAKVINECPSISAAARKLNVSTTTLVKHCSQFMDCESLCHQAWKKRTYVNENRVKREYRTIERDKDKGLEFCVNVSPEERDHVANMDYPIRFNPNLGRPHKARGRKGKTNPSTMDSD